MLISYNVATWKYIKELFIFLLLLISGPIAPGNEIDIYLRPLIDELRELWEIGIVTYDSVSKKKNLIACDDNVDN